MIIALLRLKILWHAWYALMGIITLMDFVRKKRKFALSSTLKQTNVNYAQIVLVSLTDNVSIQTVKIICILNVQNAKQDIQLMNKAIALTHLALRKSKEFAIHVSQVMNLMQINSVLNRYQVVHRMI
jgi:trimethylamine:corrinoid methyltransferase-like protein